MRFLLVSDTHIGGRFDELMFNKGVEICNHLEADYLVHCGDLTNDGTLAQYEIAKLYLEKFNENKKFIIIPGNHDAVRKSLPQSPISKEYAEPFYQDPRIHMFGNPVRLSLNGVEALISHGKALDDVLSKTPPTLQGGCGKTKRASIVLCFSFSFSKKARAGNTCPPLAPVTTMTLVGLMDNLRCGRYSKGAPRISGQR